MAEDPIHIILDKCVGCRLCVKACPFAAITMVEKKAVIELTKCTLCGACVKACKFDAIEMKEKTAPAAGRTASTSIPKPAALSSTRTAAA